MMKWEVTRGVTGKLVIEADGFSIVGDALVFQRGGVSVFALAKGEWAVVRLTGDKDV